MMHAGIEAELHADFADFSLRVSLSLPGRGVSALFGPSGSGKTSCLRTLAGLMRPRGFVRFADEIWQDDAKKVFVPTHRRAIGVVFQEASLFAHLSVRGNVEYGLRRVPPAQRRIALEQAIELLGIAPLLERRPQTLSGGERQRVAIARALAVSPRLLLMDEPLSALDIGRKEEIIPYLERLPHELDLPIVYVSHAPDEVARLADHLVVLREGKVLASGPLSEVLVRLDTPIRLGEEAGVVLPGKVAEHDETWVLMCVSFPGGRLWVRRENLPLGAPLRLRVLARDVSLARSPHQDASVLNVLPARVEAIGEDEHPADALVRLTVGESALLARITRRSAARLDLHPGQTVWAQIKAVAVLR